MSRITKDENAWEGSLDDGQSETLTLQTSAADDLKILVDNGTTGSSASSYDLIVRKLVTLHDDEMVYVSKSGVTDLFHEIPALSSTVEVEIMNSSGTNGQNYRVDAIVEEERPVR